MKISTLRLQNFKRFTDLTIDRIPPTAKLVLLIGANGCGKSSVFDAFEAVNTHIRGDSTYNLSAGYYLKDGLRYSIRLIANGQEFTFPNGGLPPFSTLTKKSFYGRTSFRQISRLTRTAFGQNSFDVEKDSDRPFSFIERDRRFENDIEKIAERIVKEIFHVNAPAAEIRAKYVDPINASLERIFGTQNGTRLKLSELTPPVDKKVAQIRFKKGASEFHYDNLSAGEKEVVNILIDLLVRREYFTDSIYFFDELDMHLNTAIQARLLKEIVEHWIPDNCQMWTASHSFGFIDHARQAEHAAIINFDDLDFDHPQVLAPEPRENLELYEIAVPKNILFDVMKGKRIIFCENKNDRYYNLLLLPNTLFVGVRDSREVFLKAKMDGNAHSLRDRDFLSDAEIGKIHAKYPRHHVLRYCAFENYLFHPDNIAEIVKQKNENYAYILTAIGSSRMSYEEFKNDEDKKQLKDADTKSIVDDFVSGDLERFYKLFDIKTQFNKAVLNSFKISHGQLCGTQSFKSTIREIVGG